MKPTERPWRAAGLVIVAAALALAGCEQPSDSASHALAIVGDCEILPSDLQAEIDRRLAARHPVTGPSVVLEEMVLREAQIQRALAMGMDRDPEVRRAWENLLIGKLREEKLPAGPTTISVTDKELRAAMAQQATADPVAPAERRRLAVLVRTKPLRFDPATGTRSVDLAATDAARERLQKARRAVADLPPDSDGFGPLAIQHSNHQRSRYRGGILGWIEAGACPPDIEPAVMEAGFRLGAIGECSEIVETENALSIVRLLETGTAEAPKPPSEQEVRHRIATAKWREKVAKFEERVQLEARVVIHEDKLVGFESLAPRGEPIPPGGPLAAARRGADESGLPAQP